MKIPGNFSCDDLQEHLSEIKADNFKVRLILNGATRTQEFSYQRLKHKQTPKQQRDLKILKLPQKNNDNKLGRQTCSTAVVARLRVF